MLGLAQSGKSPFTIANLIDDFNNDNFDELLLININLANNEKRTVARILEFADDYSIEMDKSLTLTNMLEIYNITTDFTHFLSSFLLWLRRRIVYTYAVFLSMGNFQLFSMVLRNSSHSSSRSSRIRSLFSSGKFPTSKPTESP